MRKILFLQFFMITTVLASEFTGTGFGQTMKEAKHEALSDLSQSIKVEVRSVFVSHKQATGNSVDSYAEGTIKVTSNLPIIGAEFEFFDNPDNIEAVVKLSPSKAKNLYAQKLDTLYSEIETYAKKVSPAQSSMEKEQLLGILLNRVNEYDRYQSVAIVLGVEKIKQPAVNKAAVRSDLLALQSNIDSMTMAANVLAKSFNNYNRIYLYPPKQSQSHEITPFAKALKMQLASGLQTVPTPAQAAYWLMGEYTESANGVVLSYTLVDVTKRENSAARTIAIPPKAYNGYRTKPKSISFDKLLHEGIVVSDKLKVSIGTNKGSEELLFTAGEEINLMVKLNKTGYFYVVGYTQTDQGKHAYLLELEEAPGNAKFIRFVNADDANRWMSLGTFTVEPPFGIESLQVIASNHKISKLPASHYDEESGYYLIGKGIKEGVAKTRGLIKKKPKNKETVRTEAVLMFTTMQK
ncbi:MAG: DUF4384 domain-containing protein [Campylobacterota bacterium]|nr:DUF4384 domain-containing protein [Campylobacterota bacterium]